jgi:hypothetical protein
MELEPEVIAFVEFYIQAGFKAGPAYKLVRPDVTEATSYTEGGKYLRKPEVQQYLKARLEDMKAGADEVVAGLTEIARDQKSTKKERLQALSLLGKVHGIYLDRSEVNVRGELSWREFIQQDGKDDAGNGDTSS